MDYDVTILTLQPGNTPKALPMIRSALEGTAGLLACWTSELGALNQVLILRRCDEAESLRARVALTRSDNMFGVSDLIVHAASDRFRSFEFMPKIEPGQPGPFFEVRTYRLKPNGLTPTINLWREWAPKRQAVSPLLAALYSVSGAMPRIMHIWPYRSLDERGRLRAKATADGVWPPPGGPDWLAVMQSDIYLPTAFSPLS